MNTRKHRSLYLSAFLLIVAVLGAGCSSSEPAPDQPQAQQPQVRDAASAPQSAGATIGIFSPSAAAFALSLTFEPDFAHNTVQFGTEEDLPVAGDWDGKGSAAVGVFRPSDATFRLLDRNITSGGAPLTPSVTVQFGMKGDIPLGGDWDGNHKATIGVYRPEDSTFYLRNSNTPGKPDVTVSFGQKGDVPISGDWDGNGSWTIGVYRPSDSTFYLRNSNTPGTADMTIAFGAVGDTPVVGDWDGNATTTIGVRHEMNYFMLRNQNSPGDPDIQFWFGGPDDKPIAGKWSRD